MAINKVAIDGTSLIDLSTDTVASADDIALGKVGHLNTGEVVTGTHQGGSQQLPSVTLNTSCYVHPTVVISLIEE